MGARYQRPHQAQGSSEGFRCRWLGIQQVRHASHVPVKQQACDVTYKDWTLDTGPDGTDRVRS